MRYLILTYYTKADGKIDEAMTLAFKKLQVVKANLNGDSVPKDFNRIVEYYMQHYKSTIERLFKENGYEIDYKEKSPKEVNEQSLEQKQSNPG